MDSKEFSDLCRRCGTEDSTRGHARVALCVRRRAWKEKEREGKGRGGVEEEEARAAWRAAGRGDGAQAEVERGGARARTWDRTGSTCKTERFSWRFIRLLVAWQDQRDAGQRHPRAAFISMNVRAHGRRETNVASNAWACAA